MACLAGGISVLILAPGVSTGPIAATGFALRSFALTSGAVTLRLYIPSSQILGFDFIAAY